MTPAIPTTQATAEADEAPTPHSREVIQQLLEHLDAWSSCFR